MDQTINQKGQATTEYILMLAMIVIVYVAAAKMIRSQKWGDKMMKMVTKEFIATYKYGHPKAKDKEPPEASVLPEHHPRAVANDTIRIFINPSK